MRTSPGWSPPERPATTREAVAEHVVPADVLEPRRAEAERYAELHARYLRVRDHAASSWDAER